MDRASGAAAGAWLRLSLRYGVSGRWRPVRARIAAPRPSVATGFGRNNNRAGPRPAADRSLAETPRVVAEAITVATRPLPGL